jgi:hypothetical protein
MPGVNSQSSSPLAKVSIASLDVPTLQVEAQYNPKELQIDKQIPWQPHNERNNQSDPNRQPGGNQQDAEINSAPRRSMTVEMLFDKYESLESIQPELDRLEKLSSIEELDSSNEDDRRPHHCVVTWGTAGIKPFRCVIESLTTKITMFARNGTPLRATCTVKLKEVIGLSKPENTLRRKLHRAFGW